LDPFHSRGLDALLMLLFMTGRKSEFREVVTRLRLARPDSVSSYNAEILLRAMDGDKAGVDQALARFAETGYAELVPVMRTFADIIQLAQSNDLFLGGQSQQFAKFMTEYAKLAQNLSRMAGDENPNESKLRDLMFFQLPMFQALSEMPSIKGL